MRHLDRALCHGVVVPPPRVPGSCGLSPDEPGRSTVARAGWGS
ncbi:Hypothetical protein XNRR2_0065 [Streptomyces albidoflavus]|nr:Hypothetical protein XNR_0065 [Streptomyces albidoflavus]ALM36953.1 hypothetical protein SFR_0338 [Streptomyces sp. FR-008]QLP90241.1 Hypothetical protein XNRR2_0065 [Streptomyces albidoflavus]WAE08755.1 Hypothetical protein SAD14_0065 [Streptomyces albidoflavus]WAE14396.1 Hypothetical protein SAD14N_0065 [Streptomyces albidoflavus]